MKTAIGRNLLIAATVAVVAAIAAGVIALGPPSEERARRLDARRVDDLRQIASTVSLHRKQNGRLPASLDDVSKELVLNTRDPERDEPYGYRVVDDRTFELCATFDRIAEETSFQRDEFAAHRAGRRCFTRTVRESP